MCQRCEHHAEHCQFKYLCCQFKYISCQFNNSAVSLFISAVSLNISVQNVSVNPVMKELKFKNVQSLFLSFKKSSFRINSNMLGNAAEMSLLSPFHVSVLLCIACIDLAIRT